MTNSASSIASLVGIGGATTVLLAACLVSHAQAASLTALADLSGKAFQYDGSTYRTLNVPPSWGDITLALDISGNTVVGWFSTLDDFGSIYEDFTYGFSVQIPEPSSAMLVAIAGLGLLARRRRLPLVGVNRLHAGTASGVFSQQDGQVGVSTRTISW